MEETILTVEQVAQILQVHPFTVLKFIKKGKLKAAKLGRVYRIRRTDVDKFLDDLTGGSNTTGATQVTEPGKKRKKVSPPKDASAASALTVGSGEDALPDETNTAETHMGEHTTSTPEDPDKDHYEINFTI